MSTPSDSIATDASVVDDDASIARRATDDFLSDAVSALRVSSREPARRVVLCPVVDDEASVDAVRWALRHLVRDGDALHILHVLPNRARDAFEYAYAPPSSAFAASPVPGTRDDDDAVAARRRLDRARARRFVRERRIAWNAVRVGRHDGGKRKRRHRGIDLRGDRSRRRRRRVHVDARPRTGGEILRRERRELLFEKRDDAGGDGETGGTGEDAEIARRVRRRAVTRRFDSMRCDSIRFD